MSASCANGAGGTTENLAGFRRASDRLEAGCPARRALKILADGARVFHTPQMVRLELLPKPTYERRKLELEFYEDHFTYAAASEPLSEALGLDAEALAGRYGLAGPDALHIAAAIRQGVDEFYTSERPGKPMFRVKELQVISLHDVAWRRWLLRSLRPAEADQAHGQREGKAAPKALQARPLPAVSCPPPAVGGHHPSGEQRDDDQQRNPGPGSLDKVVGEDQQGKAADDQAEHDVGDEAQDGVTPRRLAVHQRAQAVINQEFTEDLEKEFAEEVEEQFDDEFHGGLTGCLHEPQRQHNAPAQVGASCP